MSKKVKINGEWVTVEDKDVQDAEENEDETPSEDKPVDENPSDDEETGDEKSIEARAKAMGEEIAKNVASNLNMGEMKEVKQKMNKMMEFHFGNDSKLKQILNGKDLFSGDELTKEEKIVGFYHALVTDNQPALKALSEGTDADGGYLFPNEFLQEMVRELPEINVMRQYVRIIPMRRNKMDITNLVSGPEVTWTSENATKSTTTARWNQKTLTAYKMAAILYSSDELIEDSDIFDVVSMIVNLFSEAIAEEEEKVIWQGNGTSQPKGIDTSRSDGDISSFAASSNDFDSIIQLYHNLPRKYRTNAAWFMNDNDVKDVRKLKDSNGQYLWQPSTQAGTPDRLLGKPVVVSDWVPENTVYFGDMRRAYFLGDRKRMTVKTTQDSETAFTKDQTAIRVVSRIAGLTVLPNAVRAMTSF